MVVETTGIYPDVEGRGSPSINQILGRAFLTNPTSDQSLAAIHKLTSHSGWKTPREAEKLGIGLAFLGEYGISLRKTWDFIAHSSP